MMFLSDQLWIILSYVESRLQLGQACIVDLDQAAARAVKIDDDEVDTATYGSSSLDKTKTTSMPSMQSRFGSASG